MNERLNRAPCGYFVMNDAFRMIEANEAFVSIIKREHFELMDLNFQQLLTVASRVYFQTYFEPIMNIQGKVRELYLTLKVDGKSLPVLMNANAYGDTYECIVVEMSVRNEYESEMMTARKNAERVLQDTDEAYTSLLSVMNEHEQRKQELIRLNAELNELAITDNLTHLKNRRFFEDRLAFLLDLHKQEGVPFSICMIDVDEFKKFNDTFGHLAGDFVLKELGKIMESHTRNDDLVSRFGGEEFIILLPSVGVDVAVEVIERLRMAVEDHEWIDRQVTISCGLTECRIGDDHKSIVARADDALYRSKENGRNRVTVLRDIEQS